jgi:hypothetical protein
MSKPTVRIYDCETGETIDREMTDAEFAQYEADQTIAVAKAQAETEAAEAKTALLERLGITADEAKLLLA